MRLKRSKQHDSLFIDEEEHLSEALKLLEKQEDDSIDWTRAYQDLVTRYAKLLQHTSKLVKISDHTQKNLQSANSKIQKMADTENLTGLPNRRGSLKLIENEISKSLSYETSLALFILDIDFFKAVNDSWGHATGDLVLKQLAKEMRENLRNQDILGRWGGEEFILILSDTNLKGAKILSEKIRKNIEKFFVKSGKNKISVTVSMGGTIFNHGVNLDKNLEYADLALYKSKKNGRNRISFYEI